MRRASLLLLWAGCYESHVAPEVPEPIEPIEPPVDASFDARGPLECLRVEGRVRCRGAYRGFVLTRMRPIEGVETIPGIETAVAIDVSDDHGCAALESGEVACWGFNSLGQLGAPAEGAETELGAFHEEPVRVPNIDDAIDVAAGSLFSCALHAGGGVSCWGVDALVTVELERESYHLPRTDPKLSGVVQLEADGSVGAARTRDGRVLTFGSNGYEALAHLEEGELVGEARGFPREVIDVEVYGHMMVALDSDGDIWNWGIRMPVHTGPGATDAHGAELEPLGRVEGATELELVSPYQAALCATLGDGTISCRGADRFGELGRGHAGEPPESPFAIATRAPRSVELVMSHGRSYGLDRGGRVFTWGATPATARRDPAAPATPFEETVTGFAAGHRHGCAIAGGATRCWGQGPWLGHGSPYGSSVTVPVGLDADAIETSGLTTCAIADGGVHCWGDNEYGQARGGPGDDPLEPVRIALDARADAIAVGPKHACALAGDRVFCWGDGRRAQLGDERLEANRAPTEIASFRGATSIAVGTEFTCAVVAARVLCVGDRSNHAMGSETRCDARCMERIAARQIDARQAVSVPVEVPGTRGASAIHIANDDLCAWIGESSVCWGRELHAATEHPGRFVPAYDVRGGATGAMRCTLGERPFCVTRDGDEIEGALPRGPIDELRSTSVFACALAGGRLRCWGDGTDGELGDGGAYTTEPIELEF
jgi:alpha-tubulin suppressor-like RCC1 family protein